MCATLEIYHIRTKAQTFSKIEAHRRIGLQAKGSSGFSRHVIDVIQHLSEGNSNQYLTAFTHDVPFFGCFGHVHAVSCIPSHPSLFPQVTSTVGVRLTGTLLRGS